MNRLIRSVRRTLSPLHVGRASAGRTTRWLSGLVVAVQLLVAVTGATLGAISPPPPRWPPYPPPVNFGYQDRAYTIPVTNFAIRPPAVSGDTVVVYQEPIPSPSPYTFQLNVFVRSGGSFAFQQTLTPSDATAGFISLYDISGDTIVVGSADDSANGANSGAAYIFERSGAVWTQTKTIYASDAGVNGGFGQDVAIDGDTVMVGAAGGVYVFERNLRGANNWGERKKITGINSITGLSGDTLLFLNQVYERNQGGANNWGLSKTLPSNGSSIDGDLIAGKTGSTLTIFERNLGGANNWGTAFSTAIADLDEVVVAGNTVVASVMPGSFYPVPAVEHHFEYYRKVGGTWQLDQSALIALGFGELMDDTPQRLDADQGNFVYRRRRKQPGSVQRHSGFWQPCVARPERRWDG